MSYKSKTIMHGRMSGGSILLAELVDFPGIQIADVRQRGKGERHITFDEKDFNTIAEAITAWRGKYGSETNGNKEESQEGDRWPLEGFEEGASGGAERSISGHDLGSKDGAK